ncbi:mercury(II) reductase [Tenacibaculum sp. LAR 2:5]|jgi:mercuric reductase|uniref:Mercuric reductase n=3 Tax=Flavobacteriaceae TaxID=49546 RepID=A0A9X4ENC5_9FLAO|nr:MULTISPECIES: mercury(II) reductase [Flavobacteriaceae]MBA4744448.1 mercury(II) reductase [Allomuricauda sp.]MBW8201493.1 mercury(II) reductase [Allomuricauda abyssi]MDE1206309.1 mercury(II) reductase [Tenacibaculum larymnensis]|tara:strand:- start:12399 stop:14105 length:1707 start_codon:yes stop_codon:yes gene_type:complete
MKNTAKMKIKMPQNRETITLEIEGMTCEGCATHIEKDMNATEGVLSSTVNHETGKGEFNFDADKMSKANVIDAINSVGDYSVVNNVDEEEVSAVNSKGQNQFDLIIIGGGSAAFSAAIKAEGLGLTTLMVNAGLDFGGTCVNVGCVPSKNLIRAAETVRLATHSNFKGIKPKGADIDFTQTIKDKKALVASLQQQKYMDVVSDFENLIMRTGWAELVDNKTILVDGKDTYTATNILMATGATTNIPNIEGLNEVGYLTNVTLFDLEEKPESLTIMGAGYIGLEIAMAYNRLGVKVRIIEFTDRPLRSQTKDITDVLVEQMKSEGIEILPNFRAFKFEKKGNDTIIHCNCPDGSTTQIVEKGHIVVATGTKPNTSKLGLENIGLKLTVSGHIIVNEKMETNISNIYAAGDVTITPAFVYTAATEGSTAVHNAFSSTKTSIDYSSLPWVVFTDPQIAGAGIDEIEAEKKEIPFEVSKLDLIHVPRALAAQDTRGFIKLIRNTETDKLIGARVVAPEGGELIQQLSMAIKFGITVKDLAESFYPYLTLGESVKLAAITFGKDVSKLSCCAS